MVRLLCLCRAGYPQGVPGVQSHLKVQGSGSAPVCVGGGSPLSCKSSICKAQAVSMPSQWGGQPGLRTHAPRAAAGPSLLPVPNRRSGFLPCRRNREAVLRILPPAQLRPSQGGRGAPLLLDVREHGGHEGQRQEGHFSVSGGRDCCRLWERRRTGRSLLGCARCAEAVRVWLWFCMALTLENPGPDAHARNQLFSLGSGIPSGFQQVNPEH